MCVGRCARAAPRRGQKAQAAARHRARCRAGADGGSGDRGAGVRLPAAHRATQLRAAGFEDLLAIEGLECAWADDGPAVPPGERAARPASRRAPTPAHRPPACCRDAPPESAIRRRCGAPRTGSRRGDCHPPTEQAGSCSWTHVARRFCRSCGFCFLFVYFFVCFFGVFFFILIYFKKQIIAKALVAPPFAPLDAIESERPSRVSAVFFRSRITICYCYCFFFTI